MLATPQEVADEFRTTKATVLRWQREGVIPAVVAVGKVYRFDMEAVRAALKGQAEAKQRRTG